MQHLRRADRKPQEVFVLGSGTIGEPIVDGLVRAGMTVVTRSATPWSDRSRRRDHLADSFARLPVDEPVDLIWAAGSGGFSVTEEDASFELEAFDDAIEAFVSAADARGAGLPAIHVVSSAGGLFEGMHVTRPDAVPAPVRPYGRLKLAQEQRATSLAAAMPVHVYRPSSVYTHPLPGRRPGLIGALLKNGLARSPTPIIGALDTLRDYVHAQDVGRHIARTVLDGDRLPGLTTSFLVNGEPASIHRVLKTVERILRRRLLLQIREAWNAADITFSPSIRARGFGPMGVAEGTATILATLDRPGRPS